MEFRCYSSKVLQLFVTEVVADLVPILQIIYSCSVQKNLSKKHQILEKRDYFENLPSCRGYSL